MDPHPTPFRAKRRPVAAPAKSAAPPKPKTVATARGKTVAKKSSPAGVSAAAAPQPRTRRVFGTVRSSNSLAEKPAPAKVSPPPPQKPVKASPPPLAKPAKASPPPAQKPTKVSPPPAQKPAKVSPPPGQKPSKLSPPNPARAARPSRPAAKPLKKTLPGPDLDAKPKKKSHKVSFQDDPAPAAAPAPGSGNKVNKASTEDAAAAGHTPMVRVKALEKGPAKVAVPETPFFSAQNCSSCTLHPLESADYWLAHIRLAESAGKHGVSAAFFRLAFECQAQPLHRIQGELRNYVVRHESAITLTPLFEELSIAHGMAVNQPKFDIDASEKLGTETVDNKLDALTLVHECLDCDCAGEVDMIEVNVVKQGEEQMDQPSFERKLDESFEFDDCEAVIVDRLVKEHPDLEKDVGVEVPCEDEIIQSACRSSINKLSSNESPAACGSPERRLLSENHLDKLSPSARNLSAKRLSSGSPFDKKSPFGSATLKRLTSSCPSYKKSSTRGQPSKRMSSGGRSDGEHNATAGAGDSSKVIQEGESDCYALVDPLELKEHGEHAAVGEIY
ncbi:fibrous sheath CABYR-binding protein-like [Lolium rigidum]|uniref:fibrous sheath CABYR-binding protein-like n=1 Tax=Lolium rigidum TaxID=89674 RepID=UPI001F5CEA62|nr:fibrous sheath CABYR-binding protein-like [Lolium rigidum]